MDTEIGDRYFASVPESMYTLLIYGTLMDNIGVAVADIASLGWFFAAVFFLFVLVGALTVMNMLIGVLCEVVSAVAAVEREEMTVSWVRTKLQAIVEKFDESGDNMISRTEFEAILSDREGIKALQEVGVDPIGLVDFADFIFEESDHATQDEYGDPQLSFTDFMEVVLQFRGSNNATVKDVVDLRKFVRTALNDNKQAIEALSQHVRSLGGAPAVFPLTGVASHNASPTRPAHSPELASAGGERDARSGVLEAAVLQEVSHVHLALPDSPCVSKLLREGVEQLIELRTFLHGRRPERDHIVGWPLLPGHVDEVEATPASTASTVAPEDVDQAQARLAAVIDKFALALRVAEPN
mmetsp:Transcript_106353/g.243473  ORF Transcript_106353/g.243473 Transcript_106353/m.243473 type:complete len:354 (-) Transcript_106353:170-1231(-)